jgi:tRNA(Arg) A34 adenosine deaminase TadA
MNDIDRSHLERCIELAEKALELGNSPFGSVLVAGSGHVLAEDHNRETTDNDDTLHPEFELARWAAHNMTREERAKATVYTSGEHCPMCSAAHAWVGLGRIVYVYSAQQYAALCAANGLPPSPVAAIPSNEVTSGVIVEGPEPALEERIVAIHKRRFAAVKGH